MTISIIIPVFNGEEWLKESIESALNQTVKSEIILINDGSTDKSLDIAFDYPIKIIDQVNKGLASARNTGIMWASGEFVLPLDCDDILLPNAVEKILEKIEQTNADIVAGSFKEFGLSNREVILMENPILEDFKEGNKIGYCCAIRRSALLAVGGYSSKMVEGYEDLHLTINLLNRGFKLVTISDIIWLYRVKSSSMYTKAIQYHKKLLAQINRDFPESKLEF